MWREPPVPCRSGRLSPPPRFAGVIPSLTRFIEAQKGKNKIWACLAVTLKDGYIEETWFEEIHPSKEGYFEQTKDEGSMKKKKPSMKVAMKKKKVAMKKKKPSMKAMKIKRSMKIKAMKKKAFKA
jgi:hypothetical protein